MTLGDKLTALRKENQYTQEQLADLLGVSRQSVSKWESNLAYPETEKLIKLGELYRCSMDYLLKDEQETPSPQPKSWTLTLDLNTMHFERKSRRQIHGLPLWHINIGFGRQAKGVIAIGFRAKGILPRSRIDRSVFHRRAGCGSFGFRSAIRGSLGHRDTRVRCDLLGRGLHRCHSDRPFFSGSIGHRSVFCVGRSCRSYGRFRGHSCGRSCVSKNRRTNRTGYSRRSRNAGCSCSTVLVMGQRDNPAFLIGALLPGPRICDFRSYAFDDPHTSAAWSQQSYLSAPRRICRNHRSGQSFAFRQKESRTLWHTGIRLG